MQCSVELDNNRNTQQRFTNSIARANQANHKGLLRQIGSNARIADKQLRHHGRQSPRRPQQGSPYSRIPTNCTSHHRRNQPQRTDLPVATYQELRPTDGDQLRPTKLAILRPPTTSMAVLLQPPLSPYGVTCILYTLARLVRIPK